MITEHIPLPEDDEVLYLARLTDGRAEIRAHSSRGTRPVVVLGDFATASHYRAELNRRLEIYFALRNL